MPNLGFHTEEQGLYWLQQTHRFLHAVTSGTDVRSLEKGLELLFRLAEATTLWWLRPTTTSAVQVAFTQPRWRPTPPLSQPDYATYLHTTAPTFLDTPEALAPLQTLLATTEMGCAALLPVRTPGGESTLVMGWQHLTEIDPSLQLFLSCCLSQLTSLPTRTDLPPALPHEQLRVLSTFVTQGFVYIDHHTPRVTLNEAAARWLNRPAGTHPAEELALALHDLRMRASNQEEIMEVAHRLVERPDKALHDWLWKYEDPEHVILRVSYLPIRQEGLHGRLWLFDDVTREVTLHDNLLRTHALLQESQQRAHLGHWEILLKNDTRQILWSDELYQIFGLSPNTPISLNDLASRVHPEDAPGLLQRIGEAAQLGTPYEYTYRIRRNTDGQERILHTRGYPQRAEGGKIRAIRGITQDVTPLKRVEQELRQTLQQLQESHTALTDMSDVLQQLNNDLEVRVRQRTQELQASNERFALVAQATNDVIWDHLLSEPTVYVSPIFEQLFGYIREQEEGHTLTSWFSRIHPDDLPRVRQTIDACRAAEQRSWQTEYRLLRADQTYAYVLGRGLIVYDAAGQPYRMVGSITDISTLKEKEQALQAQNEQLLRINNDLDNFVYVASHDLKHPIANLEGLLQVFQTLVAPKLPAADLHWLSMMAESHQRLRTVIQQLSEIAKVQKGLSETAQEVAFQPLLDEIQQDIAPLRLETRARLHVDFQVPTLLYPRKDLRSILYNLLSNALKYHAPARSPEVWISTYQEQGQVVLQVRDNGLGLAPEDQTKAFEMYKRLHAHVEGSGIGLYIIKRIIENHGGTIEITSELNKGSIFTVRFN
ncbi:PAS domain S-box-containing protein [Catalinimonas alkaloidigena]|uniref:histidine kinase n=1 Tax=Catalinimonas alkaloidigena TaxID=1075417 RepID=A0A1G9T4N6_9BACT|nr:PAS domain-containing protein [Catalinimonas alkaloidigena]SDM42578.1 PAS domain S-box-containing protein [Catalinimonas alkaloidigena]